MTWDGVTTCRIREFHEVMDIKGLSHADMIRAGVPEVDVQSAWDLVHTPEHEEATARRRELIGELRAAGTS